MLIVDELYSDDLKESFKFHIHLKRFQIDVFAQEKLMITINPEGSGLLVENTRFFHNKEVYEEELMIEEFMKNSCPVCEVV